MMHSRSAFFSPLSCEARTYFMRVSAICSLKGFPPSSVAVVSEVMGEVEEVVLEGEGGVSCVSLSLRSFRLGLGGASDSPAVVMETAGLGVRLGDFPLGERALRLPSPRAEGVVPMSSDLSSLTMARPGLGLRRLEIGLKALLVLGERTTLWSPSSLVAVIVGVEEGEGEGVGEMAPRGLFTPCLARLISVPRGLGGL